MNRFHPADVHKYKSFILQCLLCKPLIAGSFASLRLRRIVVLCQGGPLEHILEEKGPASSAAGLPMHTDCTYLDTCHNCDCNAVRINVVTMHLHSIYTIYDDR